MVHAIEYMTDVLPTMPLAYPASTVLGCPECGAAMVLRKSLKFPKPFYGCIRFPQCRATHGAHPDGKPLGIPANAETKRWRIMAHAALDPLWGRDDPALHRHIQRRYRNIVYAWLGEQLGFAHAKEDCHIAMFDVERCKQVIEVCKTASRDEIFSWQAERMTHPERKKRKRRPPRYGHY